MGWIISTCILGALLLFVLFFDDYVAITDLRKEIARKNIKIDNQDRLISMKNEIEKLQDENIAIRDVKIARQETEITLLRERVQEQRQLIDRLSNSNMNAPQPIIDPQVIQRIA